LKNIMRRIISWLRNLGWKWRILILAALVFIIIVVVVPTAVYYSRDRKPANYGKTQSAVNATYLVGYDNGDGFVNSSLFTVKIIEAGVLKDGETTFHVVTVYDPFPKRMVHVLMVGSTKVTLSGEEMWRSQSDLRLVHKKVMQKDLPLVNTAYTQLSYTAYENYPGWPYHLNDSWTYKASYDTDTPLQPNWTDTFHAEVVADDAIVEVKGIAYQCYKVVHTLTDTTNHTSPGDGIGTTYVEYWYKNYRSIGPVKIEDSVNFKGTETQIMMDAPPLLPY
jgi:hypothetical protein